MRPHGEFLGRNLSRLFCCNMKQSWGAAEPSGVRVSVSCQTPAQELSVQCVGGQRPVSGRVPLVVVVVVVSSSLSFFSSSSEVISLKERA